MASRLSGRASERHDRYSGKERRVRPREGVDSARLPSAPRERRPLLAALALLLIVGGALLAGLLAVQMDKRVQMLAAADTIQAGQTIAKEDLVSASVSSDLIDQVIGRTARVEVAKGQLLDASQIATAPVPGGDQQVVGVSVASGRFPAGGLGAGDMVDVVDVGNQSVSIEGAQVLKATPSSGTQDDWTSGAVISLVVKRGDAAKLASASANGTIAVVQTSTNQPIKDS